MVFTLENSDKMATVIRKTDKGLVSSDSIGPDARVLLNGSKSNNNVDIIHEVHNIGAGAPLHYHKFDTETFYVLKGKYKIEMSSKEDKNKIETVIATPGDFVICPTFTYRSFAAMEDKSEVLIINAPSKAVNFLKDLWAKSNYRGGGSFTKEQIQFFQNEHGIVIESPQSKL